MSKTYMNVLLNTIDSITSADLERNEREYLFKIVCDAYLDRIIINRLINRYKYIFLKVMPIWNDYVLTLKMNADTSHPKYSEFISEKSVFSKSEYTEEDLFYACIRKFNNIPNPYEFIGCYFAYTNNFNNLKEFFGVGSGFFLPVPTIEEFQ